MSRIRTIKPEFWLSDQVMNCSHSARLLFIGLWGFCDDGGVHPASIRKLKAEVFPGDDVTLPQVQGWLDELLAQRLVVTFEADYKEQPTRFWFVTGWEHQKIEKPYLKFPQYQGKSLNCHSDENDSDSRQPFADPSPTVPQPFADHSPQVAECIGE